LFNWFNPINIAATNKLFFMEKLTSQQIAALRLKIHELNYLQTFLKVNADALILENKKNTDRYKSNLICQIIVDDHLETFNMLLNEQ
jgi:hypothetical protein